MTDEGLLRGDWSTVVRIDVYPGDSHVTWPEPDRRPWRTVDDPADVAALVAVLREAQPAEGLPAPVLSGAELWVYGGAGSDDSGPGSAEYLDSVALVSPTRAHVGGRDFVWPRPVPAHLLGGPAGDLWAPDLAEALAQGEPAVPEPGCPELSAAWDAVWPAREPTLGRPDAVRLDVPRSQWDPRTDDEFAAVVRRCREVLDVLAAGRDVWVTTESRSASPMPHPLPAPVAAATPGARHWRSEAVAEGRVYRHLYAERMSLDPGLPDTRHLDALLCMAADEAVERLVVAGLDCTWVYTPGATYAEVSAVSEGVLKAVREAVRRRFTDGTAARGA